MKQNLILKSFFTAVSLFSIIFISNSVSAGTITGTIKYEGDVPTLREIKMDADPICLTHHEGAVFPQVIELGDGQTLGNSFVHVVSGLPQKQWPAPSDPVVLDQKGCMYTPHVVGVMVGQPLKILNPDGTLHNVHAISKVNEEFNLAMPKFRTDLTKIFDKAEFMFEVKCDVHPWMGAYISVMDHPFFNVTKKDGKYSIDNLGPGTYEIEAWHEKLGTQKLSVELAEGETKEINFTFSREPKKK